MSINSREAISTRKCDPPFFTQVSVRLRALSWVLGFLLPMRRLRERMASFEGTAFERMTSEISRLRAMSSSELDVALSICSSIGLVDPNQPAIMLGRGSRSCSRRRCSLRSVLLYFYAGVLRWVVVCREVDDGARFLGLCE